MGNFKESKVSGTSNRDAAIVFSDGKKGTLQVFDDKIRVLTSGTYPVMYVDIPKAKLMDVYKKFYEPEIIKLIKSVHGGLH